MFGTCNCIPPNLEHAIRFVVAEWLDEHRLDDVMDLDQGDIIMLVTDIMTQVDNDYYRG
jgi:hypothetical protein